MTYGRPTMTAHHDALVLPSIAELDDGEPDRHTCLSSDSVPSKMHFYLEHIQPCHTIGETQSTVYVSCLGRPTNLQDPSSDHEATHGLDAILALDEKLSRYEGCVNSIIPFIMPNDLMAVGQERRQVTVTQRTAAGSETRRRKTAGLTLPCHCASVMER